MSRFSCRLVRCCTKHPKRLEARILIVTNISMNIFNVLNGMWVGMVHKLLQLTPEEKKKSSSMRSGDRDGHSTGPLRQIHHLGISLSSQFATGQRSKRFCILLKVLKVKPTLYFEGHFSHVVCNTSFID